VERRCRGIGSADDFLRDDEGLDRLDGITMMLIAIGETVKKIERVAGAGLLERHAGSTVGADFRVGPRWILRYSEVRFGGPAGTPAPTISGG
jgi:hypothetical protein